MVTADGVRLKAINDVVSRLGCVAMRDFTSGLRFQRHRVAMSDISLANAMTNENQPQAISQVGRPFVNLWLCIFKFHISQLIRLEFHQRSEILLEQDNGRLMEDDLVE